MFSRTFGTDLFGPVQFVLELRRATSTLTPTRTTTNPTITTTATPTIKNKYNLKVNSAFPDG